MHESDGGEQGCGEPERRHKEARDDLRLSYTRKALASRPEANKPSDLGVSILLGKEGVLVSR